MPEILQKPTNQELIEGLDGAISEYVLICRELIRREEQGMLSEVETNKIKELSENMVAAILEVSEHSKDTDLKEGMRHYVSVVVDKITTA